MFKLGDKVDTVYGVAVDKVQDSAPIGSFNPITGYSICVDGDGEISTSKYPVDWHAETGSPPVVSKRLACILTKPT